MIPSPSSAGDSRRAKFDPQVAEMKLKRYFELCELSMELALEGSDTDIPRPIARSCSSSSQNAWPSSAGTNGVTVDSPPDLAKLHTALNSVGDFLDRSGIPYAIAGGMAVAVWGEPRATFDVDAAVTRELSTTESLVRDVLRIQQGAIDYNYVSLAGQYD